MMLAVYWTLFCGQCIEEFLHLWPHRSVLRNGWSLGRKSLLASSIWNIQLQKMYIQPHMIHILVDAYSSDGVAQLVERQTQDPKDWGSDHVGSKRNMWFFSESKIMCWLAVGVPNPHVYMHAQEWSRTHVKDQSSVDYRNVKRLRMHFADRRISVLLYSKWK